MSGYFPGAVQTLENIKQITGPNNNFFPLIQEIMIHFGAFGLLISDALSYPTPPTRFERSLSFVGKIISYVTVKGHIVCFEVPTQSRALMYVQRNASSCTAMS